MSRIGRLAGHKPATAHTAVTAGRQARGAHDFWTTGVQIMEPVKRALFMPPNCTSPAGSAAGLGLRYTAKVGASISPCVIMLKNTGSVRMLDSWGKPRPCARNTQCVRHALTALRMELQGCRPVIKQLRCAPPSMRAARLDRTVSQTLLYPRSCLELPCESTACLHQTRPAYKRCTRN